MRLGFEVFPNMPWGATGPSGPAWNSWGNLDLRECADRLALAGYDTIDFLDAKVPAGDHAEQGAYMRSLRAHAAALDMSVGYIAAHSTLVSPDEAARAGGAHKLRRGIDLAAAAGASSVCTFIADGFYDPALSVLMTHAEAWNQCHTGLSEAAAYAAERDVRVSIELLQGTVLNTVDAVEQMLDEVGSDSLAVTVDLGTFYMGVRPFMPVGDAIRRLGERIDIVHLKDEVGFPTLRQKNHIWFGGGIVDFAEVRQALDDIGFDGIASVEWEGWVAGGSLGVGEPSGVGLADFDRVCVEAAAWVARYGFRPANGR